MQPLEEPELQTVVEYIKYDNTGEVHYTQETQPEQYTSIEASQEPSVIYIYIQTLHEEHAASFMHPLGEPELVLRVFRVHNL